MSFEKISKLLKGDTPGRSVELHYSRIGPDELVGSVIPGPGWSTVKSSNPKNSAALHIRKKFGWQRTMRRKAS